MANTPMTVRRRLSDVTATAALMHRKIGAVALALLLLTLSTIASAGTAAGQADEGDVLTFGVSGKLLKNDLLMYDHQTDSLWSQLIGTSVEGVMEGSRLAIVPSTTTTWGTWKELHPSTTVLQEPTDISRRWGSYPYGDYESDPSTYYPIQNDESSIHNKAWSIGIVINSTPHAYLLEDLAADPVVTDSVAGVDLVVLTYRDIVSVFVDVGGPWKDGGDDTATAGSGAIYSMTSGELLWKPDDSNATDLVRVTSVQGFWFGWYDFYPDTTLYGHPDLQRSGPDNELSNEIRYVIPKDNIPAILDPTFSDEPPSWLKDDGRVIGVIINGIVRAYPTAILDWTEIANDVIDGVPIAVTYCPLCGTGIVFERTLGGSDRINTTDLREPPVVKNDGEPVAGPLVTPGVLATIAALVIGAVVLGRLGYGTLRRR